jgi:hypothetical protein
MKFEAERAAEAQKTTKKRKTHWIDMIVPSFSALFRRTIWHKGGNMSPASGAISADNFKKRTVFLFAQETKKNEKIGVTKKASQNHKGKK